MMKIFRLGQDEVEEGRPKRTAGPHWENRPALLVAANGRARMLIAAERRAIGDRRTTHMNDTAVARVKAGEHFDFGAEGLLSGGQLAGEYRATRCGREREGFDKHWISLSLLGHHCPPTSYHREVTETTSTCRSIEDRVFLILILVIWRFISRYLPLSDDEEDEDLAI